MRAGLRTAAVFILLAPDGIPIFRQASLDVRVLLFGSARRWLCGAVFGLAPALYTPGARHADAAARHRSGERFGAPRSGRRAIGRFAGALDLRRRSCCRACGTGRRVALGMRTDRVVTAQFVLGPRYIQLAARRAFYEQLEARCARLPGVEAVALSDSLPPGGVPRSQPLFAAAGGGQTAASSTAPAASSSGAR